MRGNIGVYDNGTGSVTPVYTDTIKSRVDGQLMTVHYTEGQMVNKGDPLIEIDPRPYQAALDQAEGNLARDQALLANAKIDQTRYELLVPQKAVPEQTLATQKALVQQYEGTVKNRPGRGGRRESEPGVLPHHGGHFGHGRGCGWWIPATSCTPRTPTGWW